MKKSTWIGTTILIILLAIIIIPYLNSTSTNKLNSSSNQLSNPTTGNNINTNTLNTASNVKIVEITSTGFSPVKLEIKQGETVRWINKQPQKSWPASAVHPSHTVYPGSDIKKCGTVEQSTIFDACRGIEEGEAYEFTFNQIGAWDYHDHLTARWRGDIIVS